MISNLKNETIKEGGNQIAFLLKKNKTHSYDLMKGLVVGFPQFHGPMRQMNEMGSLSFLIKNWKVQHTIRDCNVIIIIFPALDR